MASQETAANDLGVAPVKPLHSARSDAATLAYIVQRLYKNGVRDFDSYVQHA